jgi:hypothetical protein
MADPGPRQFSEALFEVAGLLESLPVPYVIFGAVAVGIWGRIRATLDVDFMVLTDDAGLAGVETAAPAAGLVVDHRWLEWNPQRRGVQVRLVVEPFRADVVRAVSAHDEAAIERRRAVDWVGRSMWVVCPEDLLLQKLTAATANLTDAVSIVEEQRGQLDEAYLYSWARRLGVEQELTYVLAGGTFDFGASADTR